LPKSARREDDFRVAAHAWRSNRIQVFYVYTVNSNQLIFISGTEPIEQWKHKNSKAKKEK